MFSSRIIRPGYVQASQDGKTFQTLVALPGVQHDIRALPVRTFSFPDVTARFFRVVFVPGSGITTVGGPDDVGGFGGPATAPTNFALAEARFSSAGRVNRWEDKAGFAPMFGFESLKTPSLPQLAVINGTDVVDLTPFMQPDGSINIVANKSDIRNRDGGSPKSEITLPPGNWTPAQRPVGHRGPYLIQEQKDAQAPYRQYTQDGVASISRVVGDH